MSSKITNIIYGIFNVSLEMFVVFKSNSFSQEKPIGSVGNASTISFDFIQYTLAGFITSNTMPTTIRLPRKNLIIG